MKTVALISQIFLPPTQTFVYDEVTAIKNFNILVLTRQLQNKEQFPYKNLYVCKNSSVILKEFSKVIKKKEAKLIHVQFGTVGLQYMKLKKLTGLPYIVTFHGYDASKKLNDPSIRSGYRKELFTKADHFIAVSQNLKNNLVNAGCPENKITVLSSGIDVMQFHYQPRTINNNQTVKILTVARFTEKKGIEYLIQSFADVVKAKPNTELLIVGQGELKQKLLKQISKLNLNSKAKIVDFMPHDEIVDIMHKCHIFCLPSITSSTGDQEGSPTVLKEAMATGMPVVSTYHSGIPDLVKDGENGFLVPEKDADRLANRLIYLIDHPEIWESMGQWGRKHVEKNFDRFKQTKKLEEIYSGFIDKEKKKNKCN
ncbi:glycosyltransferase [Petroclostridium sp. X23]|uniref:glycosyltransferase n=1 Tax=Petroclostridium sp. X23 TaxID=3045146 RepID=UPI0024ADBC79|nr:glycosyltransferase [Petroclostridium sp. X23]WHH58362.1 glycosyltransferase [Petroclostridium sp. X23]